MYVYSSSMLYPSNTDTRYTTNYGSFEHLTFLFRERGFCNNLSIYASWNSKGSAVCRDVLFLKCYHWCNWGIYLGNAVSIFYAICKTLFFQKKRYTCILRSLPCHCFYSRGFTSLFLHRDTQSNLYRSSTIHTNRDYENNLPKALAKKISIIKIPTKMHASNIPRKDVF